MRFLGKFLVFMMSLGLLSVAMAAIAGWWAFGYFSRDLQDYTTLKDYQPPVVTRVHAGDGRLLAEFAQERRVFVPIDEIPPLVIHAFLSAEDKNFYQHKGVDFTAIARALIENFRAAGSGRRPKGASTITQQVAKNFLLSNELSYERKIREAILAMRIEQTLTKERILELYLNEIFLGSGTYGVGAAALYYFNKSLDELNIAEAAYLAELPKAPSNYHPVRNYEAALSRRNWVIGRMLIDGYITNEQAEVALATPLKMATKIDSNQVVRAPFFAEEVRRQLGEKYGDDALYRGGLSVRTSLSPSLQDIAEIALQNGLMRYDNKHGWRGPVAHFDENENWRNNLSQIKLPEGAPLRWVLASVRDAGAQVAKIGFVDGSEADLKLSGVVWARPLSDKGLGPEVTSIRQVLKSGDIVMVEKVQNDWILRQLPKVQGALVALDPHTGRVLAMQGGFTSAGVSTFNRVTQAKRQPGSAFKPFIYLTALENGFTPVSLIVDAPLTFVDAVGNVWSPENYSGDFYGPTTLRVGVEKSRNLMTVRLAQKLGMSKIVEEAKRFGISDTMKPLLANALGADETTLLKLTTAYGMIANGGKKIEATVIDRIQDRRGKTIFQHDDRACSVCGDLIKWDKQPAPELPDNRTQIVDEKVAYQMTSILQGVVERGTAKSLATIGRPLAGKTGTTNESRDVWFIGYSPDLVVGIFVGFDHPKKLGEKETGGSLAVPIFRDFIETALKGKPATPFRIPPGIKQVMVNVDTGHRTTLDDPKSIWESFVAGTEPTLDQFETNILEGDNAVQPMENMGVSISESDAPQSINKPILTGADGSDESPFTEPEVQEPSFQPDLEQTTHSPDTGTGGLY